MFIVQGVTGDEDARVPQGYQRYQEYLRAHKERFPSGAYDLATSGWYFDFADHRCPHDAWLTEMRIVEANAVDEPRLRTAEITIRLTNGYHDLYLEFVYPRVYR